jgi:hypothetical protein
MTAKDKLTGEDVLACNVSIAWYPRRATAERFLALMLDDFDSPYREYILSLGNIPKTIRDKVAALDIAQTGKVEGVGGVYRYRGVRSELLIIYTIDVSTLAEAQALADATNTHGVKQ